MEPFPKYTISLIVPLLFLFDKNAIKIIIPKIINKINNYRPIIKNNVLVDEDNISSKFAYSIIISFIKKLF